MKRLEITLEFSIVKYTQNAKTAFIAQRRIYNPININDEAFGKTG